VSVSYNVDGDTRPTIQCRYKSRRFVMPLLDISPGGCMAVCQSWPAEAGDEVSVKLPGLDSRHGRIVWIEEGRTGIAFEELLHETAFHRLQDMIAA